MTTGNDILNACLARVIGIKHVISDDGVVARMDAGHEWDVWNPVQNPIEMEEVEAWLRKEGLGYSMMYHEMRDSHTWRIWKDGEIQSEQEDHDKKRALALAVQEMEKTVAAEKEGTS